MAAMGDNSSQAFALYKISQEKKKKKNNDLNYFITTTAL
jgi:hypothetical protein